MYTNERFDGYVLLETIGQGGMAVVYRARREASAETVVVKAMLPALAGEAELVDQFTAEARIQAQLSHPGIVRVHDFGVADGTPYLVMEHLDGVDLSRLLARLRARQARLPVPLALLIATQMCDALGYAHAFRDATGARRQVIHGDVSPANVMVCRDGAVKLLDFGVARIIDASGYDTSKRMQGKYPYMAPEQVNCEPIDRRADVFAAGIVVYEMLTGQKLFAAESELETLRRVDACEVPPPSTLNPEVTPAVDVVVLRALARDPAQRFASGDDLTEALLGIERAGDGRRRLGELLAELFPAPSGKARSSSSERAPSPTATASSSHRTHDEREHDDATLDDDELAPEIEIVRAPSLDPETTSKIVVARPASALWRRALAVVGAVGALVAVAAVRARPPVWLARAHSAAALAHKDVTMAPPSPTPRDDGSGDVGGPRRRRLSPREMGAPLAPPPATAKRATARLNLASRDELPVAPPSTDE
jgi:serine/threonine protein kinase